MARAVQVLAQVLTAVGVTLAAGGAASFHLSTVELRFFGNVLTSEHARLLWTLGSVGMALVGLAMLRLQRRPPRN